MIFDGDGADQDPVVTKTFYEECYAPVDINIGAPNIETNGVDVKFFMSGFIFLDDSTGYTGFIEGDFAMYKYFTGMV